jgi:hypothetical protein
VFTQQVLERRSVAALGMTTLDRLLELLRIAQQEDIARCRGSGYGVRQRERRTA